MALEDYYCIHGLDSKEFPVFTVLCYQGQNYEIILKKLQSSTTMNNIVFIQPDAILCLGGSLPNTDFFSAFPSTPLVAADGAALHLRAIQREASVIIGDMDTLQRSGRYGEFAAVPQLVLPDQESTDFEKCLEYCIAQHWRTVLVCGVHGGEMEHTLNNWSIAMRYAQQLHLCLYDAGRYGLPVYTSVILPTQNADVISLIPQPRALLSTQGLHWPLTNEELQLGTREGARNRSTGSAVQVQLHSGSLLVFFTATLPLVPVVTVQT